MRTLPAQNAATVPVGLTQRGGGPLAVKPSEDPNVLVPLAQTYLVEVELTDPDAAIDPGQLAMVKIHAKWRSGAWWVGRALCQRHGPRAVLRFRVVGTLRVPSLCCCEATAHGVCLLLSDYNSALAFSADPFVRFPAHHGRLRSPRVPSAK